MLDSVTSRAKRLATILIVTPDLQKVSSLYADMASAGHTCLSVSDSDGMTQTMAKKPDLVVVDGAAFPNDSEVWHWLLSPSGAKLLPIILLVTEEHLRDWEFNHSTDDFILEPYHSPELLARVQRALWKANKMGQEDIMVRGDLRIDTANYEVMVGDRSIELTYREYQLLKYLASNPGRAVTREVLLNKVWGFDYFGGDRTVDVHVRRLRSKIEDSTHTFIDTVRNVGYRFRKQ